MKKFLARAAAGIMIMICCLLMTVVALAEQPFHYTVALPGGGPTTNVATFTYSEGVNKSVYTSFQLTSMTLDTAGAVSPKGTCTVTRVRSGRSQPLATLTIDAAGTASGFTYFTNDLWVFRDDAIYATFTATNPASLDLAGLER